MKEGKKGRKRETNINRIASIRTFTIAISFSHGARVGRIANVSKGTVFIRIAWRKVSTSPSTVPKVAGGKANASGNNVVVVGIGTISELVALSISKTESVLSAELVLRTSRVVSARNGASSNVGDEPILDARQLWGTSLRFFFPSVCQKRTRTGRGGKESAETDLLLAGHHEPAAALSLLSERNAHRRRAGIITRGTAPFPSRGTVVIGLAEALEVASAAVIGLASRRGTAGVLVARVCEALRTCIAKRAARLSLET